MPEPAAPDDPFVSLSYRERAFVLAYLGKARCKATTAAKMAGYSGDRYTLKVTGCRVRNRPHVKAAITRLLDSDSSTVAESLVRITRRACTSMSDLFTTGPDGKLRFDLAHAFDTGGIHSIRKLKISRKIKNGRVVSESITVELYDALKCDALLLRVQRLKVATDDEIIAFAESLQEKPKRKQWEVSIQTT